MLFFRHLGRVLRDGIVHAFVTRRVGLLVVVLVGLALAGIGLAAQAAAPYVIYPFV